METLIVFPVPNLCQSTGTAALFQSLKRRGNQVSKAHRLRATEAYEGDAGVKRETQQTSFYLAPKSTERATLFGGLSPPKSLSEPFILPIKARFGHPQFPLLQISLADNNRK